MGVWLEKGLVCEAKFMCKICGKVFEYLHHAEHHIIREHFDEVIEVVKEGDSAEYLIKCWRCKHLQHIILPRKVLFVCRKTKKEIAQYDKDSDELKYFCEYEPCGFGYFEEVDSDG